MGDTGAVDTGSRVVDAGESIKPKPPSPWLDGPADVVYPVYGEPHKPPTPVVVGQVAGEFHPVALVEHYPKRIGFFDRPPLRASPPLTTPVVVSFVARMRKAALNERPQDLSRCVPRLPALSESLDSSFASSAIAHSVGGTGFASRTHPRHNRQHQHTHQPHRPARSTASTFGFGGGEMIIGASSMG